jgi:hypothetical protein
VDEAIGDKIVVAFCLDVVIDVYLGFPPFPIVIPGGRQWIHGRPIEVLKQFLAGDVQLLELLVIEFIQDYGNRLIELGRAENDLITLATQDHPLCHPHCRLEFGLVSWFVLSGGNDC